MGDVSGITILRDLSYLNLHHVKVQIIDTYQDIDAPFVLVCINGHVYDSLSEHQRTVIYDMSKITLPGY